MITDRLNQLADDVALNTGAAGNYTIGDVIDTLAARNIGGGGGEGGLFLVITVKTTATSGGAATAAFSLLTDDNSGMTTPTAVATTAAIPVASMTAGAILAVLPLPISDSYERYIGLRQVTGTAAFTGGVIDAYLTPTPPVRRAYPDAI